ncbi:MAG: hypothetical protein KIT14_18690 [bacterium]|nr:hypothetical protein [bacterium]
MRNSCWSAMRACVVAGAIAAATMGPAGVAHAADAVTGEVVDMSCYLGHPETGRGAGHRKCAETCAKKGLPMGVLAEDQTVWLLLEDHDNPKAYATALEGAAKTITVEGRKVTVGGVNGIVVEGVK